MKEKVIALAELINKHTQERLLADGFTPDRHNYGVTIKDGLKYVKIDVGTSGKYMIDAEGNIFGIKAYGQIHRGHQYGTLDTINEYNWGGYTAVKVMKGAQC